MTNAIAPGSEPDDARLREAFRLVSIPRSDNLGPADGPGTVGWDIAATVDRLKVNAHTLRYYERIGLVRVDHDTLGHRRHGTTAVRRLMFLTRMRTSGMPIRGLWRYIELVETGRDAVPECLALLTGHREGLRARIDELRLALATAEYKITGHMHELEGQAVPDNISTPNTNISSTDKEIPS